MGKSRESGKKVFIGSEYTPESGLAIGSDSNEKRAADAGVRGLPAVKETPDKILKEFFGEDVVRSFPSPVREIVWFSDKNGGPY